MQISFSFLKKISIKRNLFLVLILAVIFVSGCVEGTALEQVFGKKQVEAPYYGLAETTNQDIELKTQAVPEQVKSDRNITLYFTITNIQPFDLIDFNLNIYDPCLFECGDLSWSKGILKPNITETYKLNCKAAKADFEQDCEIKFKTEYKGKFTLMQGIAVLQQTEYYTRQQQGTLGQIAISSSSTSNPLQISLSFSDEQPFLEKEEYYMYINYASSGDGILEDLKEGDIEIDFPDNMQDIDCKGGYTSNTVLFRHCRIGDASSGYSAFGAAAALPEEEKPTITLDVNNDYVLEQFIYNFPSTKTDDSIMLSFLTPEGYPIYYNSLNNRVWIVVDSVEIEYKLGGDCDTSSQSKPDYEGNEVLSTGKLIKSLKFINNKAPKSTCVFNATAGQPIDLKSLTLTATYKYMLDNSIIVKVSPR